MEQLNRTHPPVIDLAALHSSRMHATSVLAAFHRQTLQQIPLLQAMGITFTHYEHGRLRVDMPLSPNINDKMTAFGGSIVTLATISGWALPSLLLNHAGKRYDILIGEGSTRYHSPVDADCYALVELRDEEILTLSTDLAANRKARLNIAVDIFVNQTRTASFNGKYHVREIRHGEQQRSAPTK